ncbi:MAG: hypothetical protein A3F17_01440 [Gammaproteobacteria bacterium RIFCSPHIGHO2_12_FULL_41_15]|nr:MAG: hypothetical protein A3F17_01440 [Gammaproteobacteria bacterium RIFCSPHIGHO2_12_FULL_41_15]
MLENMTVMGFDFGLKRIGVAIGNTITCKGSPLTTLSAIQGVPHWQTIEMLITEWHPALLVVGAPYEKQGGTDQFILHCAKKFAHKLQTRYQIKVEMIDERYTSAHAREIKKEHKLHQHTVDSVAAVLIIEDWLTKNHTAHP